MKINLAVRRRDTARKIAVSPWECTVYRRGRTREDAVVSFSFTGTIVPMRSPGDVSASIVAQPPAGMQGWLCVAPYDADVIKGQDEMEAVSPGGITHYFIVIYSAQYDQEQQAVMYERQ